MSAGLNLRYEIALLKISPLLNVLIVLVSWLLLWLPIAYPLALKLQWRPFQPSTVSQKITLLIPLYLIAPLLLGVFCWLDNSSLAQYGLPMQIDLLSTFAIGLIMGSSSLAILFGMQYWAGWLDPATERISWRQGFSQVGLLLLLAIWIGWTEELMFRGFLQTQLQQELPFWIAALLSSLIFALLHGIWEGKAVLPQLPGLWVMGIVLVLAFWLNQNNLGLAWGLHAGWVWTIASFDALNITRYKPQAPSWLTGLNGQPLAGVLGFLFLGSTALGLKLLWGGL